ncbi:hypothetical protein GQ42DRAFT_163577 [Ramicandelaber brevisporus]|nr:hypothetical protein GQ42DRAFT_163577 [Ramicandelaber brevisporus]
MPPPLQGTIHKEDDKVIGNFAIDGLRLLAVINLPSLVEHSFDRIDAILEYTNLDDLKGEFNIGDDSVVGPDDLILSLKSESGKKAKITAPIFPPLPSELKKDGTVVFRIHY